MRWVSCIAWAQHSCSGLGILPAAEMILYASREVLLGTDLENVYWNKELCLTGGKEVRREEASQRASIKSRVAPHVLRRRRGEDGGESRVPASPAVTTPGCPPAPAAPAPLQSLSQACLT